MAQEMREKVYDDRLLDFVDKPIPTRRRGIERVFSPGATGVVLAGSFTIVGSPSHMSRTLLVTKLRVVSGSPNCWFAIVHSGKTPATIDASYLQGAGEQVDIGDIWGPVLAIGPGTVKAYVLGPSNAGGTPPGFAGVGPGTPTGRFSYGVFLDGYEVGQNGAGA